MREVEVKAKLSDESGLVKRLQELGCIFSEPVNQKDLIYGKDVSSVEKFLVGPDFLRIRIVNDTKALFTYKYHVERGRDMNSAPIEHELGIDSAKEMEAIIALMGYVEAARVEKTRRKTKYNKWEICIDEVKGLGAFVEVEEMAENDADIPAVHVHLREFLQSVGVPEEDITLLRYDHMMFEKYGIPAVPPKM